MARKAFDRFMVAGGAAQHPKIRRLKAAGPEVRWAWFHGVLAIANIARERGQFTVGVLPADERDVALQADVTVPQARKALAVARDLGMLLIGPDGVEYVHDWDDWQATPRSEAKDPTTARRSALYRNADLRNAIRGRDGDVCRYCAADVDFADRRSRTGGTYDHIDPYGDNSVENLVVACRSCNSSKGCRTPEAAGMVLLPINSASTSDLARSKSPSTEGKEKRKEVEGKTEENAGVRPDVIHPALDEVIAIVSAPELKLKVERMAVNAACMSFRGSGADAVDAAHEVVRMTLEGHIRVPVASTLLKSAMGKQAEQAAKVKAAAERPAPFASSRRLSAADDLARREQAAAEQLAREAVEREATERGAA
jgi:5-methylcytosine-specific restriction endonuclease McrA